MPPFRNYFSRKTGVTNGPETFQDENARPTSRNAAEKEFQQSDVVGTKPSSALSIKRNKDELNEYKLSGMSCAVTVCPPARTRIDNQMLTLSCAVVNDSGVYLPVHEIVHTLWKYIY